MLEHYKPVLLEDIYGRAEQLACSFAKHGEIYPPFRYRKTSTVLANHLIRRETALGEYLDMYVAQLVLDMKEPQLTHEEYFFMRQRVFFAVEEIEKMLNCDAKKYDVSIIVSAVEPNYYLKWVMTVAWRYTSVHWLYRVASEISQSQLDFQNETWFMSEAD